MTTAELVAIARVCHEANRAYCATLGDGSQVSWDEAPQWQRDSSIDGVRFHVDGGITGPVDAHNHWCTQKYADGWEWGVVKNAAEKVHPCLVEWHVLPEDQQRKDVLFVAIVRALEPGPEKR